MRVVIAGGHGKVALHLERLLTSRGDSITALVRNPDHFDDVRKAGADPVLCDLEAADVTVVADHLANADAAVFAAGAGAEPGINFIRTETVDRRGAVLFAQAAEEAGVRRFLELSSMLVDLADDPLREPAFAAYLRAKKAAEDDLRKRNLDWTILRPGSLTDDPPSGLVSLAESLPYGPVSRPDVAAVVVALLDEPRSARRTLELTNGDTPIEEAVAEALV
jgi:uncharacterized protein YbjT (DUF2867 family)